MNAFMENQVIRAEQSVDNDAGNMDFVAMARQAQAMSSVDNADVGVEKQGHQQLSQPNCAGLHSTITRGERLFYDPGLDDSTASKFAGEWGPTMDTPDYIGTTEMLLQYLQEQERLHRVTMPIKACGIDPIVFEHVADLNAENGRPSASKVFAIRRANAKPASVVEGEEGKEDKVENDSTPLYELIRVDDDLYLSCISECLDNNYLGSILAEATACMKARGFYTFEMVGFRKLALGNGEHTARLLNTLRLNTYEMSVLTTYLCSVPGVDVHYGTIEGKACIQFVMQA